jgi:hypothetical protein
MYGIVLLLFCFTTTLQPSCVRSMSSSKEIVSERFGKKNQLRVKNRRDGRVLNTCNGDCDYQSIYGT